MSARQYLPIYLEAGVMPIIIYPAKDESPLVEVTNREKLINHVKTLYESGDKQLSKGEYHIVFAWNKRGSLMLDVWVHTLNDHSDSGPLMEFYAYENGKPAINDDIASGDTIIVLGREEENRRAFPSTAEYLEAKKMPHFPDNMQPVEELA